MLLLVVVMAVEVVVVPAIAVATWVFDGISLRRIYSHARQVFVGNSGYVVASLARSMTSVASFLC